jgi:hypothetical protein
MPDAQGGKGADEVAPIGSVASETTGEQAGVYANDKPFHAC